MGVPSYDRNITPFLKDSNPLESAPHRASMFGTCGAATKGVSVPVFEEHTGVRVHEACEPPNGIGGTVCAMVVVPAGHLALVLIATHVRGDAEDRLVDVAIAKATTPI